VERLTDLILPSDGTPGARDAGVAEFLDFYLAGSSGAAQKQFRDGLEWLDREGKPFVDLTEPEQVAKLTAMSSTSADPAGATFFPLIRRLTVFGFYTSKVGVKELGYLGNSYAAEFPGACTHQHEL